MYSRYRIEYVGPAVVGLAAALLMSSCGRGSAQAGLPVSQLRNQVVHPQPVGGCACLREHERAGAEVVAQRMPGQPDFLNMRQARCTRPIKPGPLPKAARATRNR